MRQADARCSSVCPLRLRPRLKPQLSASQRFERIDGRICRSRSTAMMLLRKLRGDMLSIAARCWSNPAWGSASAPLRVQKKPPQGWLFLFDWWRRRESNPRPQALCRRFYMRSLSFDLTGGSPDRQGDLPAIPKGFSGLAPGGPRRDLMRYDAQNLNASARLQLDGTLPGFKRRVRSCRRWQLCFLQLDLRGTLPLGMPLRFRDPRRNQVAPF